MNSIYFILILFLFHQLWFILFLATTETSEFNPLKRFWFQVETRFLLNRVVLIIYTHLHCIVSLSMAFSATFSISSSSSFTLSRKIYRPFLSQNVHSLKPTSLKASSSTSVDYSTASVVEKQSTPSKVRSFCLQVLIFLSLFF